MTVKVPIRTVYDENDNPTGLAEFQSGEAVNYTHGGTGLTSLGTAGQTLAVNSTTDGLEWVTGQELNNTDELPEGSSNLYYTDARSRAAVSVSDAGGDGSMTYNNTTGVITYTGPSATDVRSHFSGGTGVDISSGVVSIGQSVATAADVTFNTVTADLTGDVTGNVTGDLTGNVTGNVTGTVSSLSNHDTDDVTEGASNLYYTTARWDTKMAAADTDDLSEGASNLYYTDARAQAAISVTDAGGDGSLAYSSGTITYTGPSATETRAHFSAGTGVTYSSGEFSIGQAVATTSDVTFNCITTACNMTIGGNLTVNGTTVTNNADNLVVDDALIELNHSATSNASDLGLIMERGSTGDNAFMGWDESADKFVVGTTTATGASSGDLTVTTGTLVANIEGNVTGCVSTLANHDTDDVTEGSSNLYYTDARSRAAISASGSLSYNSSTGAISYTTPTTIASLSNHDTDDLSEGASNLYYTNTRARGAVSFTAGSGAYNSSTGVFSIPTNTNQLTNGAGYITCTGSISGNAATATSATSATCASKWTTARTLCICGDASGSASIDGSGNVNLSVAVSDDSHNHTIANVDGLSTCLSGKAASGGSTSTNFSASCLCAANCAKANVICGVSGVCTPTVCATTWLAVGGRCICQSAGDYGSISVVGGDNSWPGYSIENKWVLMGNAADVGIYNDVTNEWMAKGTCNGGWCLFYNNSAMLCTTSYGARTENCHCVECCVKANVVCGGGAVRSAVMCATDFNSTSDCRCKDEIQTIESAVCKVTQMRGVDFKWKDSGRKSIGVVAQEVEKVLPELVVTDEESGYKTVNYQSMVGVLIEAVKELQAEITELKKNK